METGHSEHICIRWWARALFIFCWPFALWFHPHHWRISSLKCLRGLLPHFEQDRATKVYASYMASWGTLPSSAKQSKASASASAVMSYMYILNISKTSSMKEDLNRRWPQWKMISMEDDLNGRRHWYEYIFLLLYYLLNMQYVLLCNLLPGAVLCLSAIQLLMTWNANMNITVCSCNLHSW